MSRLPDNFQDLDAADKWQALEDAIRELEGKKKGPKKDAVKKSKGRKRK